MNKGEKRWECIGNEGEYKAVKAQGKYHDYKSGYRNMIHKDLKFAKPYSEKWILRNNKICRGK